MARVDFAVTDLFVITAVEVQGGLDACLVARTLVGDGWGGA